jgi:DNA modification methylase
VPVIFQDFESEEQAYAYMVSDNAVAAWAELDLSNINVDIQDLGPDFDIDMLGIKDFTIDVAEKGLIDDDEIPEVKESFVSFGDIWQLGEHRLMCGDSMDLASVERLMGGEKADLWITDVPYGVDYIEKNAAVNGGIVHNAVGKKITNDDSKSVKEMCPIWKGIAESAFFATTDKASNYWFACQGSDKMMMMMMMMMDEAGWNIRHELIWKKSSFVFGRSDYHYRHEPIIYGWKKDGTHEWNGDRSQDSVFEIDRPHKSDLHPTTKPVELIEKFIHNSSKKGQSVIDTCGGSGSTLIAAEKTNRRCFMAEIDPHYCAVIIERWQKFTGKVAEKIGEKCDTNVMHGKSSKS